MSKGCAKRKVYFRMVMPCIIKKKMKQETETDNWPVSCESRIYFILPPQIRCNSMVVSINYTPVAKVGFQKKLKNYHFNPSDFLRQVYNYYKTDGWSLRHAMLLFKLYASVSRSAGNELLDSISDVVAVVR